MGMSAAALVVLVVSIVACGSGRSKTKASEPAHAGAPSTTAGPPATAVWNVQPTEVGEPDIPPHCTFTYAVSRWPTPVAPQLEAALFTTADVPAGYALVPPDGASPYPQSSDVAVGFQTNPTARVFFNSVTPGPPGVHLSGNIRETIGEAESDGAATSLFNADRAYLYGSCAPYFLIGVMPIQIGVPNTFAFKTPGGTRGSKSEGITVLARKGRYLLELDWTSMTEGLVADLPDPQQPSIEQVTEQTSQALARLPVG